MIIITATNRTVQTTPKILWSFSGGKVTRTLLGSVEGAQLLIGWLYGGGGMYVRGGYVDEYGGGESGNTPVSTGVGVGSLGSVEMVAIVGL